MQPYVFPYGGYYRLLAEADEFVLFDCVQFNRRGRVHRCEVAGPAGQKEWLTLPLARQSREVLIRDLEFAPGARRTLDERLARHRWLKAGRGPLAEALREHLYGPLEGVADFLEDGLRLVAEALGLRARIRRSSTLPIDAGLRRQERVVAIARALGASEYLNLSGGRALYCGERFAAEGMTLRFLPPYECGPFSVLESLATERPEQLRRRVLSVQAEPGGAARSGDAVERPLPPGDALLAYYESRLERHGDTAQGAGWPNEADRQKRFQVICDLLLAQSTGARIAVCDLGCGTGELLAAIRARGLTMIDYCGVDRSERALGEARRKFPGVRFEKLDVLTASESRREGLNCDFVVANGLFTVKDSLSQEQMWGFLRAVVERVWPHARRGVIFNVMSKLVDWERDDLFHVSFDEMAAFLQQLAGRQVGFRADYGLYEYMAYALKRAPEPTVPTPAAAQDRVPVCQPRLPRAEAIARYLVTPDESRWYSNHGPLVQSLERRLSQAMRQSESAVVTAGSGTAALVGAILGSAGRAGVSRPLCLCPAYTFVGTVAAVLQCGYRPHLVEVEPESWAVDAERLRRHPLLGQVGLVVVVAPYGRAVKLAPWEAFERETGIPVVVDAAAAIESLFDHPELAVGALPVALSFHATKAFSTAEGGAIVCLDARRRRVCMQALNFGFLGSRESRTAGTNGKLSEYHAAVGLAELDGWAEKRAGYARVALEYQRQANNVGLAGRVLTAPFVASNYALFEAADGVEGSRVVAALERGGVECRRWYGLGLQHEPYYADLPADNLDQTARLAGRLIGLPVSVDMTEAAVARVVAALAEAVDPARCVARSLRLLSTQPDEAG